MRRHSTATVRPSPGPIKRYRDGQVAPNLEAALAATGDAAAADADLVILPELYLTGFPHPQERNSPPLERDSATLNETRPACGSPGISSVLGFAEHTATDQVLNTALWIDGRSGAEAAYHKIHPFECCNATGLVSSQKRFRPDSNFQTQSKN